MKRPGHTPPFRGPHGEPVADSIAEIGFRRLGGIDQWVMIRGEDVANPPLVLLHGGPGMSETAFFRACNAPLEKVFTVVYWDQRGAGKSADPHIPRTSMTVDQFLSDLDELIDVVCRRLGKNRVVLLGHSWGSALGALYAARFPQKVELYVGCAQVGDWAAGEAASYAFALAEAERRNNRKMLDKLRTIGPPPHDAQKLMVERTSVARLEGLMSLRAMWRMGRLVLGAPESSIFDLASAMRGFRFTLDAMWAEVSRMNMPELVPELTMPAVFFLGRKDHWIPPDVSGKYIEALRAPAKKVVWFEESSHEMFVDEPAKFNAAMTEVARLLSTKGAPAHAT